MIKVKESLTLEIYTSYVRLQLSQLEFDKEILRNWAEILVENNIESDDIFDLMGLENSRTSFAVEELIVNIFDFINQDMKFSFQRDIKNVIACIIINSFHLNVSIFKTLRKIKKVWDQVEYVDKQDSDLFDFILLFWAVEDLTSMDYTDYWEGINKSNYIQVAETFLKNHVSIVYGNESHK